MFDYPEDIKRRKNRTLEKRAKYEDFREDFLGITKVEKKKEKVEDPIFGFDIPEKLPLKQVSH